MAAKKPAAKKTAKPAKSARKPSAAFMKELTPSPQLAEVIGAKPLPRTQVIKKLWEYFKKNKLNDGQTINLDDKLKAVYGAKLKSIKMTEVSKAFAHLKD
ncbi:MAG: SWIB/MDM2 domain-containing protein [Archangium sp.]|nr:SWIB/MDM2 domain-containing protein [Archangium sp.]MDP3154907.1 SWIB/MDM2 domain-containing protein [Archangium sp.]MDP3576026.1 SWIB/MDM2 domain-containing protein [Archangium sp.]